MNVAFLSIDRFSTSVLMDRLKRSMKGFSHGECGDVFIDLQPKFL